MSLCKPSSLPSACQHLAALRLRYKYDARKANMESQLAVSREKVGLLLVFDGRLPWQEHILKSTNWDSE